MYAALLAFAAPSYAYDDAAITDIKTNMGAAPQGGRLGAFLLKPSLGLLQNHDDNIFRISGDKRSDWVTSVKPEVKLQSDWNLHQVEAGASAQFNRYRKNSSENHDDFAFYLSGRYDVDYQTYFTGLWRQERLHEDRSSLDDVDGDAPLEYDVQTGRVGFTRALGILKLYMDGTLKSYTYDDSRRGSTIIDNSDRDRDQYSFKTRLSYSVSDNAQAFGQVTYNRRRYENSSTSFRNSNGMDYRAGVTANLTGKAEGELYVGYLTQDYDDGFSDISAPSFGGSLLWNLNDLTSLKASAERSVQETSLAGSSGVVRTSVDLTLQHAITEDILAEATIGLDDDTYKGGSDSANRDNTTYEGGLSLSYNFGRGFVSTLKYDYTKRNFERENNNGFENNRITAGLTYAY